MKYLFFIFTLGLLFTSKAFCQNFDSTKYIIEHEKNIAIKQPSPHNGEGQSVGYSFFSAAKDYPTAFKKRVLKPGASIGYHEQKEDEVYYVVSGEGLMTLNDKPYKVSKGDAILTRTASSHGLKNTGKDDLVLIIVYQH